MIGETVNGICSFELSGDFGTFRKPDTNSVYLTYNNPPYPVILGILGSVLGLPGYKVENEQRLPKFYKELSKIWISFYPVFHGRPVFLKKMVKYNNFHGYGSDAGCFQITEQVLICPRWRIYLYDEQSQQKSLIDKIRERQTVFTPYLGKNEFRAEISNFKDEIRIKREIDPRFKNNSGIKLDSVVLLEKIDKNPIRKNLSSGVSLEDYFANPNAQATNVHEDGYAIFENYPYSLGENLHYKLCLSVFTNWEIDTSIIKKNTRVFELGDGQAIQMFNGGLE